MTRFALALGLCLATLAAAANPKATALAKEADKLYKDNKYREAAQKLEEAYAVDPAPLYLYIIARAYDQAGDETACLGEVSKAKSEIGKLGQQ